MSSLDHFLASPRAFSAVAMGDQAPRRPLAAKPAPEMLQFTLSRLRPQPGEAIMVEDSAADIEAARAAGVFRWRCATGYSGSVPLGDLRAGRHHRGPDELDAAIDLRRLG
ncbi:MAG: HAD-IA family hydrolase [Devosia sp.]|nr:HAD-IA family hydrolase [Devosia sp.]